MHRSKHMYISKVSLVRMWITHGITNRFLLPGRSFHSAFTFDDVTCLIINKNYKRKKKLTRISLRMSHHQFGMCASCLTRVWAKCRPATALHPSHSTGRVSGWLASIAPRRNPTPAPASSPPLCTHPCTERRQQVRGSRPCWACPTCRGGSSARRRLPPSRPASADSCSASAAAAACTSHRRADTCAAVPRCR